MSCWQKRQQQILKAMAEDETALIKRLSSFYSVELCRLEKEIGAYYARYGEGNVIRHKTLMVQLSNEDKQLLLQRMEDFAKKYPQYGHLMPARDNVYKLNRLEGLQYSVAMQQLELGAAEHEQITAHLDRQAMRGLNASAEVLGFGENYYGDNSDITKRFVNVAWAGQESLSERIWRGKRRLAEHLNTEIAHSIIRGESYALLTRRLRESFTNVSRNNAYRLIYTEGTFVMSESAMYPFTEDFEKYRIAPVKDGKACDVCKGIAEQVFDIADRKAGVSFPPLHPWCRCSFEIVVEDWDKWIEEYERKHGNNSKQAETIRAKMSDNGDKNEPLDLPGDLKYGIINKKDFIEKHDIYIDDDAIKSVPENMVNEFLTGVDYMIDKYPDIRKHVSKIGYTKGKCLAEYNGINEIRIGSHLKQYPSETVRTGIHECAHILEKIIGVYEDDKKADEIIKTALKDIGVRTNSKEAERLKFQIANAKYKDPHENIAFSFEKVFVGKGNNLAKATVSCVNRRINS